MCYKYLKWGKGGSTESDQEASVIITLRGSCAVGRSTWHVCLPCRSGRTWGNRLNVRGKEEDLQFPNWENGVIIILIWSL